MNETFSHLLSPIRVGSRIYPNRVISAPKGVLFPGPDGRIIPPQAAEIADKCRGGASSVCIGETSVSLAACRAGEEFRDLTDYSDENTALYRQGASIIHENGGIAMIELCHSGLTRRESPAYGPMDCVTDRGVVVHAMTEEVIAETCRDFARAAVFMKHCGYDGVVLHAGHGWLPHQFLSPRWNQRTDRFGGSIENRSRISVMILDAIRQACGPDFLLECRLSGQENTEDGYSLADIVGYCQQLDGHCDLIHVSAGIYDKPMETLMMSTLYDPHGCNLEAAAKIKAAVSIPVAVVGGINDPAAADQWIAEGKCDLVAICRQQTADPEFAKKPAMGRADQLRKCIRCMRCYPGPFEEAMAELHGEFPMGCSVNPRFQHFDVDDGKKSQTPKKVLVVGGGVAGMQAVITAAKRGHQVTLAEQSGTLGGILNFAKDDQDKYDLKGLADSMAAEVRASGAAVLLNTQADAGMMKDYDQVILAIGSSPLLPPIPGLDTAVPAMDAYSPDTPIGDRVVILGGGLVGCETAVHLAKQGKKVTIVEMRDELAPDAYRLHKHKLRQIIGDSSGITVLLNTKCLSVTTDGVTAQQAGETVTLPADTVIAALGMKANSTAALEAEAAKAGVPCTKIGDCVRARKIYDAIDEGFMTAMAL